MASTAPPRRGRFLRRLFHLSVFIFIVCGAGAAYQAWEVRGETQKFPPPGQLVDIGGRRLHLLCIGEGAPIVLFESSGLGSAVSADRVRNEIAKRTRVCSYDRRGMGWSDPGPSGPITVNQFVDDLDQLLAHAKLPPPYVVVSASFGGLTTEMFARRHPDLIAGLVFLDAANSVALERVLPKIADYYPKTACLAQPAAMIGLVRAVDPLGLRKDSDEVSISRIYRSEPMQTICGIVRGADQSLAEFRAAPPLSRDVPLTVLIAGAPRPMLPLGVRLVDPDLVREAQREFAGHSSKGSWRIVERSDHLIATSDPAAVTAAILEQLGPQRSATVRR